MFCVVTRSGMRFTLLHMLVWGLVVGLIWCLFGYLVGVCLVIWVGVCLGYLVFQG